MKIASATLHLASQSTAITQHEVKESLRSWVGNQRPDFEGRGQPAPPARVAADDTVHLSQAAREVQPSREVAAADGELSTEDELKLGILVRTIEAMTGKKIKLVSPKAFTDQLDKLESSMQELGTALQDAQQSSRTVSQSAGYGLEYDYYERHYESEKTTFSAQGLIQTQDGQQIAFTVDMSMSREFLREQSIRVREGDAKLKDPLVLNFGGKAAELTQTRFSFDIDADGRQDQMAFVSPDSGFLALDRNGDGKINDGRELFGAVTGEGFAELAAADQDGNQWIDENDAIYSKLRIWSKDAQGRDQLVGLGQRGIGALYLGHVTTPFSLKDEQNSLLGQIRSSGVFLHENGQAGTVQQIDLSV